MKKQNLSVIFKWLSFASTAIAAVLQTIAMLLSYETKANYFFVNAPLPYVAVAFAILGAICGIFFAVLHTPRNTEASPFTGSMIPALPSSLSMTACAILLFIFVDGILSTAAAIALLIAAAYTLLCTTSLQRNCAPALTLLGFSAVIACALMNGHYYFDATLEMNAPIKVTIQTALLFAMLYYTAELRYLLGRQKDKLYLALSMITLSASSLPMISIIVAFCIGRVSRIDCLAGAILSLGIALTILFRVFLLLSAQKRAPKEEINSEADTELPENTENSEVLDNIDSTSIPGKEEHEEE